MRLTQFLSNKVGDLTKQFSNFPDAYIKRSMEQVRNLFIKNLFMKKKIKFFIFYLRSTGKHQRNQIILIKQLNVKSFVSQQIVHGLDNFVNKI